MEKNLEIERLRAVAVLIVVNSHIPIYFRPLTSEYFFWGWAGVDLFFVISGYVISRSLLNNIPVFKKSMNLKVRFNKAKLAIKNFYIKRFFRIAPSALTWMIIPLALSVALGEGSVFNEPSQMLRQIGEILTLRYNYIKESGNLGVYWSLMVEEHFYLVFPFLLLLIPKDKYRYIFFASVALITAFLIRPFIPWENPSEEMVNLMHWQTHRKFDPLAMGVILGLLGHNKILKSIKLPGYFKIIGGILTVFCVFGIWNGQALFKGVESDRGGLVIITILSTILVWLATYEKGYVFEIKGVSKILEYLGSRSFAIYLIHGNVSLIITEWARKYAESLPRILFTWMGGAPFYLLLFTSITLGLAELNFRFIERPLISRGATLVKPQRKIGHKKIYKISA